MAGEVDRVDVAVGGEVALVEHPGRVVRPKAVDEEEGGFGAVGWAGREIADALAVGVDGFGLGGVGGALLRRLEALQEFRDVGVDLGIRHARLGDDAEQRADGDILALRHDLLPEHALDRALEHVGDLGGLDVHDLLAGGDFCTFLDGPAREHAFLHGETPLRHGDGLDGGHGHSFEVGCPSLVGRG